MRWLLRVAFALAISLGVAWLYRSGLMLEAIGVAAQLRIPVGPHREIDRTLRDPPSADDEYIYWLN